MKRNQSPEFVIPISYGSTEVIETGKWGFQKPEAVFLTAPCQEACPAGNPIAQFLYLAGEARFDEALSSILRENPLPGVCGRVCFHPCEANCNRNQYDEAVSISAMERFVSDTAIRSVPAIQPPQNMDSRRIAVIGSGPAGLSCSYFLAGLGHKVTIFEAQKELGGILRWGIPEYRLPKPVLNREIQRILHLGIDARTNTRIGRDIRFDHLDQFDAVFLSPGAGFNVTLPIEDEASSQVWKGGDFLQRVNSGEKPTLGKETLVIGGGNTAMDVARSALRLGSRVTIAYRRTRNEMPALRDEIHEAEEEGAQFEFLLQPIKILPIGDKKVTVTFQRMRLEKPDESGRPEAVPMEGEFATLVADVVITAFGESVDVAWIPGVLVKHGLIDVGASFVTSNPKIFAGGDAVDQPRTVVAAIASGKKAALAIDLSLRGIPAGEVFPKIQIGTKGSLSMEAYLLGRNTGTFPSVQEVIPYEKINTLYFNRQKRVEVEKLPHDQRLKSFSETNPSFSPDQARLSALRCFSCGTCNYCYNCYFFCPEGVISLDPLHQVKTVDLAHCKGCGTCAKACPRSVVRMREEGF